MFSDACLDALSQFGEAALKTFFIVGGMTLFAWLVTDDDMVIQANDGPVEID